MVNIMVEMERNYITAEYFRTIQVGRAGQAGTLWTSGAGAPALRRHAGLLGFRCPLLPLSLLFAWTASPRYPTANPRMHPPPILADGQDARRQGHVHPGWPPGDRGARGHARGEALQAHHQPGAPAPCPPAVCAPLGAEKSTLGEFAHPAWERGDQDCLGCHWQDNQAGPPRAPSNLACRRFLATCGKSASR